MDSEFGLFFGGKYAGEEGAECEGAGFQVEAWRPGPKP